MEIYITTKFIIIITIIINIIIIVTMIVTCFNISYQATMNPSGLHAPHVDNKDTLYPGDQYCLVRTWRYNTKQE